MARKKEKPFRLASNPGAGEAAGLLALAVLTAAVYLSFPNLGFFFDDRVTILQNEKIQSPRLKDVLMENPFRALPNLSFALQVRMNRVEGLSPGPHPLKPASLFIKRKFSKEHDRFLAAYQDPDTGEEIPVSVDSARMLFFPLPPARPFQVFNLLLHLLNGLLLFLVVVKLKPAAARAGFAAAAIFMLHPLAAEPVNYITARFTLLCMTFCLLSTLFYLHGSEGRRWSLPLSLAFFLAALFSKESAAPLPLLFMLLDLHRGRVRFFPFGLLAISAVYALFRLFTWPLIPEGTGGELLSPGRYFLVEQRVFWSYLRKIALPVHLNFDPQVIPSLARDLPFLVLNLALLLGAGGRVLLTLLEVWQEPDKRPSASWIFRRPRKSSSPGKKKGPGRGEKEKAAERKKKKPGESRASISKAIRRLPLPGLSASCVFLMLWLAAAPASSFFPFADLAKEDRAYPLMLILIPAVALGFLSVFSASRPETAARGKEHAARESNRGFRVQLVRICAAVALLCFFGLCLDRNRDFKSEVSLTRDMVKKSPEKPRALYQYATALKWKGELEKALFWYERVLELDPRDQDALTNLSALKQELEARGK